MIFPPSKKWLSFFLTTSIFVGVFAFFSEDALGEFVSGRHTAEPVQQIYSTPPQSSNPTPPNEPHPVDPPDPPLCPSSTCSPSSCGSPPPAAGTRAIDRHFILIDDFEQYEIWYNVEGDYEKPYLEYVGVVRDPRISRRLYFPEDIDPENTGYEDRNDDDNAPRPQANDDCYEDFCASSYETGIQYPLQNTNSKPLQSGSGFSLDGVQGRVPKYGTPPPPLDNVNSITKSFPINQIKYHDGTNLVPIDKNTDTVHFALFEVRRIEFSETEKPIGNKEEPVLPNNQDDIVDDTSPENDPGYLITATKELVLKNGNITQKNSIQKIEIELRDARRKANADGEFQVKDYSVLRLNPMNDFHSIVGTYTSTDTRFENTALENTFSVIANREAQFFYTDVNGEFAPPTFKMQNQPYGTVFDSWTLEPVEYAHINLTGKGTKVQGTQMDFALQQTAGTDGFYAFSAYPGLYTVDIQFVNQKENTDFTFPTQLISDCTSSFSPFNDLLCTEDRIEINDTEIRHFDIPVDPTLYGEITNWEGSVGKIILTDTDGNQVAEKWILENGKYSFFVKPGNYIISHVMTGEKLDQKKEISKSITVPIPIPSPQNFNLP